MGAGTSWPSRRPSPSAFVVVAAAAVTGSAWLIVAGLAGHGLKDLWQHRTGFVAGTRWWPPFCAAVDFVAAALIAVAITTGFPVRALSPPPTATALSRGLTMTTIAPDRRGGRAHSRAAAPAAAASGWIIAGSLLTGAVARRRPSRCSCSPARPKPVITGSALLGLRGRLGDAGAAVRPG